ncbi:MAG TPA: hypothetical protein VK623_10185 [Flavobacterium sp.]|nr:hypothetical protein [Flavobacterium sp.]
MKKVLFGLIATMMFSTVSFGQSKTTTASKEQSIHLEFGRKSRNCGGFGICVFTIDITWAELAAILAGKTADNHIKLTLSDKFYTENKSRFVDGDLVMEEDFALDAGTSRSLGFSDVYTIKKGKYQVVLDSKTNTYNCTF